MGKKIIVVDDNETNRMLIECYLKELGFDVVTANDGQEAVDKIYKEKFSLCFMDIHMPNMDGYDATREIRKTQSLPIIALTATVSPKDKQSCFDAGMDAFIEKPIDLPLLKKTIEEFLGEAKGDGNRDRSLKSV